MANRPWLLLHGTPLTPQVWTDVRRLLPGRAHAPDVTPQAGMRDSQRALATRLADGPMRDRDGWNVVGHSFGGQIALDLALVAPERLATLTLVCTRDSPFPAFADSARAMTSGSAVEVEAALSRWFTSAELAADGPVVRRTRDMLARANTAALADIAATRSPHWTCRSP